MIEKNPVIKKTVCYHCGEQCLDDNHTKSEKVFCCQGCMLVYSIIEGQGLKDYYQIEAHPGSSRRHQKLQQYDFLEEPQINNELHRFKEGTSCVIEMELPDIHCSSCIFLLEKLYLFHEGISSSKVQFAQKKLTVTYDSSKLLFKDLAAILFNIGYPPRFKLNALNRKSLVQNKKLLYQIGIAGFSFGNIMLLSFPEYLGFEKAYLSFFIGYLNIALALPVFFYCGIDYLKSAYHSLKKRVLNLDLPIALGMTTLFVKSIADILLGMGEGYLDSLSGFVFFLLIGRWLQSVTYKSLDFERDYSSYFPLHVSKKTANGIISVSTKSINKKDILVIRNQELIPADAVLLSSEANIDYSFVTGESDLINKKESEKIFAGGKNIGKAIDIYLTSKVEESYLTKLWNENIFKENKVSSTSKLISLISKWYTITILIVAIISGIYWYSEGIQITINVFSSVLIVACPCALALSIPFTYGNVLRLLSTNGFYLKSLDIIEKIQEIDSIVFDKTGTLTDSKEIKIQYTGEALSVAQKAMIKSTCASSGHPLSKAIVTELKNEDILPIDDFADFPGMGCQAIIDKIKIRVGSSTFIFDTPASSEVVNHIHIEIDGKVLGHYTASQKNRKGLSKIMHALRTSYGLHMLTGDSKGKLASFRNLLGQNATLLSSMQPADKMNWINKHQNKGHHVMMVGDGLNDAGALKQSNVGLVIADDINNFSPSCDGIFSANNFVDLPKTLKFIRSSRWILWSTLLFAFIYNGIGLYFAINNLLSPIIAAILMPASSITVVLFGVSTSSLLHYFYFRKK